MSTDVFGRGRRNSVGWKSPRARDGDAPAMLEALESRVLLFAWTAQEVYLTELVNRARADPLAEGARLGLNLTEGLTAAEAARLVPSEPLALDQSLTVAARAHSLDMANRDFFDHVNPDGLNPTQRVQAAGYAGTAGENIAAGYTSIDEVHRAWLESVDHRKNVLSLYSNFTGTFHYTQFGPGFAFTSIAPFFDYYTENFGVQVANPDIFLLGAVYTDSDQDYFYSVGEGAANIEIDVTRADDPNVNVGSYTTDAAGNYQLALLPGDYTVTFTNLGTGLVSRRSVTISGVNVQMDMTTDQITQPPGTTALPDDHANSGDFPHATVVFIEPTSGDGISAGALTPASDTDLFRFTVAASGTLTLTITPTSGSGLHAGLRVFGASQNVLGDGTLPGDGSATFQFSVALGQTYFALVSAMDTGTGSYVLSIDGPGQVGGGGGGPGDGTVPPPVSALLAGTHAVISGSAQGNGRLTLTTANGSGRPIVFQQTADQSGWTGSDLLTRAGGINTVGEPVTWTDPKDGKTYVGARSNSGLLLFTNAADGSWSFRNLSAEIPGAGIIMGTPTVLISTDGVVTVAGLSGNGELILYTQTGASGPSGYVWTFVNVSQRDLYPQGLVTPQFASALISYVTPWNALTVAGLDLYGNIRAVWIAPGMTQWSVANLTAITGAAPLTGGLTAYLTPWGGINVGGVDQDGHVSVAWWVPGFAGQWRVADLTTGSSGGAGPLLVTGSVTSYITSWGGLNVVGVDTDGRLVAYWWSPDVVNVFGADQWQVTVLSDLVTGTRPLPSGQLAGVSVGDSISIAGITGAGNIVRYWWNVGGNWQAENITDIATPV